MLDYNLAEKGELSLYEYLYRRIRDDIAADVLEAGDRLPSKRSLAQHLGVSLVTVEGAYAQLVAEGYVRSRPRSGYFVNALPGLPARTALIRKASAAQRPEALALAEAAPAASGESRELARLWSRALRDALAGESESELFSPAPPRGLPRLRAAISDHLRQTRGMQVDPSRIVVGAGAQVLDNMIVQLLGHDLTYGVEDPGYLRLTRLYRASGARVAHIGLDDEGVRMDELAASRPDVMHLMPSHQFPTGRVTSIARRYELLGWACAEAGSRWIIEDDYDCEFRLAGRPVPALASIDATGSVIYTNTFSKGLGAALRLAYMVLPGQLMERYGTELGFYSTTVSSVQQVPWRACSSPAPTSVTWPACASATVSCATSLQTCSRSLAWPTGSAWRRRTPAFTSCWRWARPSPRRSWWRGSPGRAFLPCPSLRAPACQRTARPRMAWRVLSCSTGASTPRQSPPLGLS